MIARRWALNSSLRAVDCRRSQRPPHHEVASRSENG
jgi:hypothetical protein